MTDNGLEIKVTPEEFKHRTPADQSYLIFKAITQQQYACKNITEGYDNRLGKLETDTKLAKAKIAGIAIGSGSSGGAFALWVKSLFMGGG